MPLLIPGMISTLSALLGEVPGIYTASPAGNGRVLRLEDRLLDQWTKACLATQSFCPATPGPYSTMSTRRIYCCLKITQHLFIPYKWIRRLPTHVYGNITAHFGD
ncbi:hypothetical protein BDW68DRAFT_68971 [Aspergillus falconensis]